MGQGSSREIVDDVNRLTFGDQPVNEVRADEPGATDDEHTTTVRLADKLLRDVVGGRPPRSVGRDSGVAELLTIGNLGVSADDGATEAGRLPDHAGHDRVLDERPLTDIGSRQEH